LQKPSQTKSHLIISNKSSGVVKCFGLSRNPSNGNYVLVLQQMDNNLREYLQQTRNKLTWKERINIICEIIKALYEIHKEKAIHRDLHSGNILYLQSANLWCISDLGLCGPADKSSKSIYGNIPYIAPEVIIDKAYTLASDIYSIAILMWEVSSGYLPFIDYKHHDYELAMNIIDGMRPEITHDTPLEYKQLMKQCWDSDPLKRPDIYTILKKIDEINLSYQNTNEFEANDDIEIIITSDLDLETTETNYANSLLSTSKIYQFENLFEPKNATEGIC
jgi:serine/threonine protein kinase